jgi:hypothetical protein
MNELSPATWIVTDADEASLDWHDVPIRGVLHTPQSAEVIFDIDYALKWVQPTDAQVFYSAWTAPATLVFHDVRRLITDLQPVVDTTLLYLGSTDDVVEPDTVIPEGSKPVRWWIAKCPVGYWRILASGFTQYFRRAARLTAGGAEEARAVSFVRGRESETPA